MSSLAGWSKAIQEMGEEANKKHKERLEKIKKSAKGLDATTMSKDELLELYDDCMGGCLDSSIEIRSEYRKIVKKLRAEILNRMEK